VSDSEEFSVPDIKLRQKNVAFVNLQKNEETQISNTGSLFESNSELGSEDFGPRFSIKEQLLAKRRKEFIEVGLIKVLIGSWNVAEKQPKETLDKWLHLEENPDIIAIGLQEIDMSALTVVIKEESNAGAFWDLFIQNGIDTKKYQRVFSQQLVGIYHILFIKKELSPFIKNIYCTKVGTGDLGVFANKGGIGIRFDLYETSFCFFSAHLAAHKKEIEKRNKNFMDIMGDTVFEKQIYAPLKHDYIFFYGDLNYRIQLKYEAVLKCIKEKDFETLLSNDQLTIEKKEGRVLENFSEGKIKFAPTYKFDKGTNDYESEKKRIPSYTDRILYRSKKFENLVKVYFYDSCMDYLSSDHKPIVGYYGVEIEKINFEKYDKIMKEEIDIDKL